MSQSIVQTQTDSVTLDQVRNRWKSIFETYADGGLAGIANFFGTGWSALNNPFIQNTRIKQINQPATKVTKKDLQEMMGSPEESESTLRGVSMHLYFTHYIYNNLIKLNRDTPCFKNYFIPQYTTKEDMKTDKFKQEARKVDKILKKFNPELTFKTIATQVNLEGKSSYLIRLSYNKDNVDYFKLQKLNSDMVKLTGFGSKQQFIASFNMMIFLQPGYDPSQYPSYIGEIWDEMIQGEIIVKDKKGKAKVNPKARIPDNHELEWNGKTYMYWVQLPQSLCYTFYSDGATPAAFPDTIGLFTDLNDLEDYKWLQASLLSKGVNSVLTAEVPLIKDPKPGQDSTAISPDTVIGYQDFFAQMVSANIFPFFAPFEKFEMHDIENQPESMDIIYNRTRDLIATSGNSALMSITDKPSIASVKAAESIQASKNDYLTRQFEEFLNEVINTNFGLKFDWKVNLWGDIFYIRDDIKIMKELVLQGATGLIPKLLSGFNMTLEDYKSSNDFIDSLGITFEVDPNYEEKNPVGRPTLGDTDVENDSTGTSKDMGNNVSDIKEFEYKQEGDVNE